MLCLVLDGRTVDEDVILCRKYDYADMFEMRLDYLLPCGGEIPAEEYGKIKQFPALTDKPVLLTFRRKQDGGAYVGSEAYRLSVLSELAAFGFAYADIEEDVNDLNVIADIRKKCRVVRSVHLFDKDMRFGMNAEPCGGSELCVDAEFCGDEEPCGDAESCRDAELCGGSEPCGDAEFCLDAEPCGDARFCMNAEPFRSGKPCGTAGSCMDCILENSGEHDDKSGQCKVSAPGENDSFAEDKISFENTHSFKDIAGRIEKFVRFVAKSGDIPKAAVAIRCTEDLLSFYRMSGKLSDVSEKVIVGMGKYGIPSRILYKKFGSSWTYCVSEDEIMKENSMMSLHSLKREYCSDTVNAETKVYGIIGNPVYHSASPVFHNRGFKKKGLNAIYAPFLTDNVNAFFSLACELQIRGFSVTSPFKGNVVPFLCEKSEEVERTGACNTVIRSNEKCGDNVNGNDSDNFNVNCGDNVNENGSDNVNGNDSDNVNVNCCDNDNENNSDNVNCCDNDNDNNNVSGGAVCLGACEGGHLHNHGAGDNPLLTKRKGGFWCGFNTDAGAVAKLFSDVVKNYNGRAKVLVLGAGGASAAVAAGFILLGAEVVLCNRTVSRAEKLAKKLGCRADSLQNAESYSGKIDIIVQAISEDIDLTSGMTFSGKEILCDLLYNPLETKFLKKAREKGLKAVSGRDFHRAQAFAQFKLFTGMDYPEK